MRIPYKKYTFNLEYIHEEDYIRLKDMLERDKKFNIEPPHLSVTKMFNKEFRTGIYALISIAVLLLVSSLIKYLFKTDYFEFLEFIAILPLISLLGLVISVSESISYYKEAVQTKNIYYSKVQEMILRSTDYMNFWVEFRDRHYVNYNEYYNNMVQIQRISLKY